MVSVEINMDDSTTIISEKDLFEIREKALKIQKRQNVQLQQFLSRLEIETLRTAFLEEKRNVLSKFYLTCLDTANSASNFKKLLKMPFKEKGVEKFLKRLEGFYDIQAMLEELERAGKDIDKEAKKKKIDLSAVIKEEKVTSKRKARNKGK